MSASDEVVAKQLLQDNVDTYVSLINKCLDKQDATLMLRGLRDIDTLDEGDIDEEDKFSDPWNYHNQLRKYISLLEVASRKPHYDQKTFAQHVMRQEFIPLDHLIRAIPANIYDEVIPKVQATLESRYTYFVGLRKAVPTDQCIAIDVAWFHRLNKTIINKYLKEHPDNKILRMKESELVRVTCDLMSFKISMYQKLKSICDPLRKSKSFFHAKTYHEVANYYNQILLLPLFKSIVNNRSLIITARPLMTELLRLYWDFDKKTEVFVKAISFPAQEYIKTNKSKVITPFFQNMFEIIKSMEDSTQVENNFALN